jgi:hypothetical protein
MQTNMKSELLPCNHSDDNACIVLKELSYCIINPPIYTSIWTMSFDGSKSQYGARVGCILIDPLQRKTHISCRLEFKCTNNTAEYEALVQGLKKSIDLKVKFLCVFGDSEIIIRQVRNTIHCMSPHLRGYQ